ncbi:DegV family protein [Mycoplasmoides alvi]|uniref:DegV family protein n=1 Tax=Mycoplasmoides alvi TaxID=78580 RepID=UPI0006980964|nr:DegV family protein [Mycoplasmoides alvi]
MGNGTVIITDTSSTIKPNEFQNIKVISLLITIDDKDTYLDGREISSKEIHEYFVQNKSGSVKTSLPRASDVINVLNEVVDKYDQVIMLPISSGLSGTYNQWKTIVNTEFENKKNIYVFDTKDIAISLKWLILDVQKLCNEDKSIVEIENYITQWHKRISCTVVLNDLTQARNGGRIGKIASYLGTILKIKPILHFHDGKNTIIGKKPTNRLAIEFSLETFDKIFNFAKNKIAKIGFCSSFVSKEKIQKTLIELKDCLKKYKILNIEQSDITPLISAHTGNDAFSINILIEPF